MYVYIYTYTHARATMTLSQSLSWWFCRKWRTDQYLSYIVCIIHIYICYVYIIYIHTCTRYHDSLSISLLVILQKMKDRPAQGKSRSGRYKTDDTDRLKFIHCSVRPLLYKGKLPRIHHTDPRSKHKRGGSGWAWGEWSTSAWVCDLVYKLYVDYQVCWPCAYQSRIPWTRLGWGKSRFENLEHTCRDKVQGWFPRSHVDRSHVGIWCW